MAASTPRFDGNYRKDHPNAYPLPPKKGIKLYLFGPMRSKDDWNFPAFAEARERLRAMGHTVFCPAAIFTAMGYSPGNVNADYDHLKHVIQSDLACIYAADALVGLDGWEGSVGCGVEVAMAIFLDLPIYSATTLKRVFPLRNPWLVASRDQMAQACFNSIRDQLMTLAELAPNPPPPQKD